MADFLYEVGDEFEGPPAYVSRFMKEVFKVGGQVELKGNTVKITYLPQKASSPAPEPEIEEEVETEVVVPAPEPVVEEDELDAEIEEEFIPKRRGRPRKDEDLSKDD